MKLTSKTALGAMVSALSIAFMLLTAVLPFMSYSLPAITGLLIVLLVIECDKKWAFVVYVTVSLLSLLIVPDKSAAFSYLLFFGYYPIIKSFLETKMNIVWEKIIKFLLFNAVVLASYFILLKFFGIETDSDSIKWLTPHLRKWYIVPVIMVFASVFFAMYDIVLTRLIFLYETNWRKKFSKMFKF